MEKSFCGNAIFVQVQLLKQYEDVFIFGEFCGDGKPSFQVGDTCDFADVESNDDFFLGRGKSIEKGSQIFAINPFRKWRYLADASGCEFHRFVVYLVADDKVIDEIRSTPFRLYPPWRREKSKNGEIQFKAPTQKRGKSKEKEERQQQKRRGSDDSIAEEEEERTEEEETSVVAPQEDTESEEEKRDSPMEQIEANYQQEGNHKPRFRFFSSPAPSFTTSPITTTRPLTFPSSLPPRNLSPTGMMLSSPPLTPSLANPQPSSSLLSPHPYNVPGMSMNFQPQFSLSPILSYRQGNRLGPHRHSFASVDEKMLHLQIKPAQPFAPTQQSLLPTRVTSYFNQMQALSSIK